ncbi:Peptidyl-prolyl cis-trans isomerase D [Bienertia sinuspersici]
MAGLDMSKKNVGIVLLDLAPCHDTILGHDHDCYHHADFCHHDHRRTAVKPAVEETVQRGSTMRCSRIRTAIVRRRAFIGDLGFGLVFQSCGFCTVVFPPPMAAAHLKTEAWDLQAELVNFLFDGSTLEKEDAGLFEYISKLENPREVLDHSKRFKEEGNSSFKEGDIDGALEKYGLSKLQLAHKVEPSNYEVIKKLIKVEKALHKPPLEHEPEQNKEGCPIKFDSVTKGNEALPTKSKRSKISGNEFDSYTFMEVEKSERRKQTKDLDYGEESVEIEDPMVNDMVDDEKVVGKKARETAKVNDKAVNIAHDSVDTGAGSVTMEYVLCESKIDSTTQSADPQAGLPMVQDYSLYDNPVEPSFTYLCSITTTNRSGTRRIKIQAKRDRTKKKRRVTRRISACVSSNHVFDCRSKVEVKNRDSDHLQLGSEILPCRQSGMKRKSVHLHSADAPQQPRKLKIINDKNCNSCPSRICMFHLQVTSVFLAKISAYD